MGVGFEKRTKGARFSSGKSAGGKQIQIPVPDSKQKTADYLELACRIFINLDFLKGKY